MDLDFVILGLWRNRDLIVIVRQLQRDDSFFRHFRAKTTPTLVWSEAALSVGGVVHLKNQVGMRGTNFAICSGQ